MEIDRDNYFSRPLCEPAALLCTGGSGGKGGGVPRFPQTIDKVFTQRSEQKRSFRIETAPTGIVAIANNLSGSKQEQLYSMSRRQEESP